MSFIMEIFLVTFQAVAALLGIGVLGFWIIGRRRVPSVALGLLTAIAIDVALPCLILANILTQFSVQKFPDWWQMPLWWLGFTILVLIMSLLGSLISKKVNRGEFAMSLFYQNGTFFPLIIIVGLYGNASNYLVLLFLFIFLQASMIFSTYPLFFRNKSAATKLSWQRIINPVLVLTVTGLFFVFTGVRSYIPGFIITILTLVGAMATPLFMLILGGNIYNDFMNKEAGGNKIEIGEAIKFIALKNLVFPLVVLGLLIWIRPNNFVAFLLLLQAAIPPITALPIFAEREGGNRALTSQFIVASFCFSILSIPLMLLLFSRFFEMPIK
jgi:malate permease and related proteins